MGNAGSVKKPRHPIFFHSCLGWFEYAWEVVLVMVIMAQFLNGINSMWFFTIGFLLATILINAVFYLINMFWFGPYYKKAKPKLRLQDCKSEDEYARQCELTYNQKIANDLKYHNDERHFRLALFAYIFIICCYGIFLSYNGGQQTFQPLPTSPNHDDIMAFVIVKGFQILIMVAVGGLMFTCFDTHSCFMFSQWASLNKDLRRTGAIKGDLSTKSERHGRYLKDIEII